METCECGEGTGGIKEREMGLEEVSVDIEYRSLKRDIIKEFYEPLLARAISYKRAVGFFTSSSLIEISYGIQKLVENGGTIQLVASPKLKDEDIKAIEFGYESRDKIFERVLLENWEEPNSIFKEKRLNLLAYYICIGKLDIKLAFIHNQNAYGIFHEKLGLISDGKNTVAFSGSMNESETAFHHNYETIDVFCDWKSEDAHNRVKKKQEAFERIWSNSESGIEVIRFPQVVLDKIQTYNIGEIQEKIDKKENIDIEFQKEVMEEEALEKRGPVIPDGFQIRDYQRAAIDEWEKQNFKGIFDMATGTGKTYTALLAIERLFCRKAGRVAIIIVCPYQHLVEQWVEDLQKFNINPIVGYSATKYKEKLKARIFDYNLKIVNSFCFICTNATFKTQYVQNQISKMKDNVLLVVDEAHNFGASGLAQTMDDRFRFRLALSATLERHNDMEGTECLYRFFGKKCIEYSLDEAIQAHMLTPYCYFPILVYLTDEELTQYTKISLDIAKCIVNKKGKQELNQRGKILALKRAKLVAGASRKCDRLLEELQDHRDENNILVYCGATTITEGEEMRVEEEEVRQIDYISRLLGNELEMRVAQFTSRENKLERKERIEEFKAGELQALIAIKCLDEGVNIPGIQSAYILASTTNPKEYIQRRGRVLRLAEGKKAANIYDFVTFPRPLDYVEQLPEEVWKRDISLVKNELARVGEFKRLSLNPFESDELIVNAKAAYRLYEENEMEEELWQL